MDGTANGVLKLFAGNAQPELARAIAAKLGMGLGAARVRRFADGEISVSIDESVRGCDIFLIQPTCPPVDHRLMELLIMTDAFRRASARRINLVVPYFGYARQDRKARARDPITAKMVANLIACAGADRILIMDLHAEQIQGYFDIPCDHLFGAALLARHFRDNGAWNDPVVVAPDLGAVKRSRRFAQELGAPLVVIDKRRPRPNESEVVQVIGAVEGRNCIVVDDIIDTGGTLSSAAHSLKELGAATVRVAATHGVFSKGSAQLLQQAPIEEMVVLDTILLNDEIRSLAPTVLSTADLLADAILRVHEDRPLAVLFE
ncbi:Ribose-phosphate pyrophosphokinase [Clostridiaceae bacterium JG1575]|nr:Ribose-phosphate pyrophosphokinase [Clostridiaceae bacterium JG1575]